MVCKTIGEIPSQVQILTVAPIMTGICPPKWLEARMKAAAAETEAMTPEERLACWRRQMKAHQEYDIKYGGFECVKKIKEAKYVR